MTSNELAWARGDACTLPTAERPLRLAEFDALFRECLVSAEQRSPTEAVLLLRADADRVRDLTARETQCCSFFVFTVTEADETDKADEADGGVVLRVNVPRSHAAVLAALVDRARTANQ